MVPISGQCARVGERARKSRLALAIVSGSLAGVVVCAGTAVARERVSLPYSCSIDRGRLRVEPATDRSYSIVGQREQQVHTYCPDQSGTQCRTWTVHRFAVSCGGGRASWSEIVAAATANDRTNVALENGQLLLRVTPQNPTWRERLCGELERAPWRGPATWERCQGRGSSGARPVSRSHMVALPRGFAPLALIGARVLPDGELAARIASTETIASTELQRVRLAPAQTPFNEPAYEDDEPWVASAELPATPRPSQAVASEMHQAVTAERLETERIEPKPASSSVEAYAAVALAPSAAIAERWAANEPAAERVKAEPGRAWPVAWTTRVEATPSTLSRDDYGSNVPHSFVQVLVAGLLGTALLVTMAVTRRRRTARVRSNRVAPNLVGQTAYTDGDGERAVALRTKSDGHIALITNALDRLSTVVPLRNALSRELQSSERRLAVVIAAIGAPKATPEDWTKARRRLERIAQDLDRLQQISDSAVHSLSGLSAARSLPRDKAEAYATLGITSGVSEPILKKLVEALRVSWHPDLAQGEADRALRDARIKEINVAWDLITGKRESE